MKKLLLITITVCLILSLPAVGLAATKLTYFDTVVVETAEELSRETVLQNVVDEAEREKEIGKNKAITAVISNTSAVEAADNGVKKINLFDVIKKDAVAF